MRASIALIGAVGLFALSSEQSRAEFQITFKNDATGSIDLSVQPGGQILVDVYLKEITTGDPTLVGKTQFSLQVAVDPSSSPPALTGALFFQNPTIEPYISHTDYIFDGQSQARANGAAVGTAGNGGSTFSGGDQATGKFAAFVNQAPALIAQFVLTARDTAQPGSTYKIMFDTNQSAIYTGAGDNGFTQIVTNAFNASATVSIAGTGGGGGGSGGNPVPAPAGLLLALTGAPLAGLAAWRPNRWSVPSV